MCFCFDGESAVAAYRPDECRERLPDAGALASLPAGSGGVFGTVSATGSRRQNEGWIVERAAKARGAPREV
ncbi:hypothetical protein [Mesorhizobium sp. INR15]|uniref:hypothetical protein n=1 Tax=Mesorhizobium sp. INR15 TaxID=2654248 RepID=UPI00189657CA|nr:hypothetical protein [Mesorhizobium sp. INR15]QPC92326.1 hypothetical protein GA829_18055 [Mesorhizobium sp. INR15]